MQSAKDSFYVSLRDRLAQYDPQRTATIDGVTRPAIAVVENEPVSAGPRLDGVYYLEWGAARSLAYNGGTLMTLECTITYTTAGTLEGGADRGRALASLDEDLMAICSPPGVEKSDYSTGSAVDLGSGIFWSAPKFGVGKSDDLTRLGREVAITLFFYPEVNQA